MKKQCKLREVKHREGYYTDTYSIHNNRFELFSRDEKNLNEYELEQREDFLDLPVLEVKKVRYSGYGVSFPVTHIKLDIGSDEVRFADNYPKYGEDLNEI